MFEVIRSLKTELILEMKLVSVFEILGNELSIKLCYKLYTEYDKRLPNFIGQIDRDSFYVFTEDGYMSGADDYICNLEGDEIIIDINTDKKLSKNMRYNYIKPKKYFVTNGLDLELVNLSKEQLWNEEIERRYVIWREVNSNKPVDIEERIKRSASSILYLVCFILIAAVFIYMLTLLPSSDCVDADKFGVNQVCGNESYRK